MSPSLDAAEVEIWRAFTVMRRQLDLTLERRLQADAGISSADFAILVSLQEQPDHRLRAGRIGDIIGWEKSRVSHQLKRMEQRGLISRVGCDDDARGVWIKLTADGRRATLAAIRDHSDAIRQYFFDHVDQAERELLLSVSHRVLDTINPPVCSDPDPSEGSETKSTDDTTVTASASA